MTLVAEMRAVVDDYPGRVLIGEIYLPVKELMTYYGQDLKGDKSALQLSTAPECMERGSCSACHL